MIPSNRRPDGIPFTADITVRNKARDRIQVIKMDENGTEISEPALVALKAVGRDAYLDPATGEATLELTPECQNQGKTLAECYALPTGDPANPAVWPADPNLYQVIELKAPEGYRLVEEGTTVLAQSSGTTHVVTHVNPRVASLTITKIDGDSIVPGSPTPLEGAQFRLVEREGTSLHFVDPATGTHTNAPDAATVTTDAHGKATWANLDTYREVAGVRTPVQYELREINPARGYRAHLSVASTTPTGVTVTPRQGNTTSLDVRFSSAVDANVTLENQRAPIPPLPFTGGLSSLHYITAGSLTLALAAGWRIRSARRVTSEGSEA